MTFGEGDPVWVSLPEYEGTGVVVTPVPGEGLIVQVRAWDPTRARHRTVLVREHLIPYAVRAYTRTSCVWCGSVRMVVDGMPRGALRWVCCDCMGGQDT